MALVKLMSSSGDIFEVNRHIACVSPVIAELLDHNGDDEEVPLPLVSTVVLGRVIDHCERHSREGHWEMRRLAL